MPYPIPPAWFPLLALASPILVPWALVKDRQFRKDRARAAALNQQRLAQAAPLDLPALELLEASPGHPRPGAPCSTASTSQ